MRQTLHNNIIKLQLLNLPTVCGLDKYYIYGYNHVEIQNVHPHKVASLQIRERALFFYN